MRPQGFLLIAITFPNIILGSFILLRNLKDKTNIFFSMFAFFVGFWALGLAGFIFTGEKSSAIRWAQFYYSVAAVIALAFYLFSLSYTGNYQEFRRRLKWVLVPPVLIIGAILLFPSFMITDIAYREWGKEVLLNKSGYIIYGLYFSTYVILGFKVILQTLKKATGLKKLYLRYISIGLMIAFGLGATFNLFYPFFGNYYYIWVGPLFTLVYISLVSYAIVRHRLFDIRLIVARSLAYLLSISAVGIIFSLFSFTVLNALLFRDAKITFFQQVAYTVAVVFIAIAYQPLRRFFDKTTNKFFYKDAYEPQEFLENLNRVLVSNIEIQELLRQASQVIEYNLKAEYCVFSLAETEYLPHRLIGSPNHRLNEEKINNLKSFLAGKRHRIIVTDELEGNTELQEKLNNISISVFSRLTPLAESESEEVGYLILGRKKSGGPYSHQDVKILKIIINELVIATQNALRFEEIEKFNITLQEKVEAATKKLQRTNTKLMTLDETKDEFISMASHQLRTPLTSVKGYLSMVLEGDAGELNEMQKKLLDQAFNSSQRMVYLIADLLNLSRLKNGKFIIDAHPTNLADVVESEISQLKESAASRGLKLEFEKPAKFSSLMLDETKIRQVIMNFTDNAIYYTPTGGNIKIALHETKDIIEFTVTDNGIGVPKAEQPHLFSKFYRAGNAKKARPDGTGLGLFMAKKVVIAQGGALIFTSHEGKGSTFGFSFAKEKLMAPQARANKTSV